MLAYSHSRRASGFVDRRAPAPEHARPCVIVAHDLANDDGTDVLIGGWLQLARPMPGAVRDRRIEALGLDGPTLLGRRVGALFHHQIGNCDGRYRTCPTIEA